MPGPVRPLPRPWTRCPRHGHRHQAESGRPGLCRPPVHAYLAAAGGAFGALWIAVRRKARLRQASPGLLRGRDLVCLRQNGPEALARSFGLLSVRLSKDRRCRPRAGRVFQHDSRSQRAQESRLDRPQRDPDPQDAGRPHREFRSRSERDRQGGPTAPARGKAPCACHCGRAGMRVKARSSWQGRVPRSARPFSDTASVSLRSGHHQGTAGLPREGQNSMGLQRRVCGHEGEGRAILAGPGSPERRPFSDRTSVSLRSGHHRGTASLPREGHTRSGSPRATAGPQTKAV